MEGGRRMGWLHKLNRKGAGQESHKWKRRWLVMEKSDVLYYTSEREYRNGSFKGKVSLLGMQMRADVESSKPHCFALVSLGGELWLAAESEEEKQQWVVAMENTLAELHAEMGGAQAEMRDLQALNKAAVKGRINLTGATVNAEIKMALPKSATHGFGVMSATQNMCFASESASDRIEWINYLRGVIDELSNGTPYHGRHKTGFLWKVKAVVKLKNHWKRRWCVVDGSDLVYYENDEMATVTATGMLNLGKGTVEYGAAVAESLMGTGLRAGATTLKSGFKASLKTLALPMYMAEAVAKTGSLQAGLSAAQKQGQSVRNDLNTMAGAPVNAMKDVGKLTQDMMGKSIKKSANVLGKGAHIVARYDPTHVLGKGMIEGAGLMQQGIDEASGKVKDSKSAFKQVASGLKDIEFKPGAGGRVFTYGSASHKQTSNNRGSAHGMGLSQDPYAFAKNSPVSEDDGNGWGAIQEDDERHNETYGRRDRTSHEQEATYDGMPAKQEIDTSMPTVIMRNSGGWSETLTCFLNSWFRGGAACATQHPHPTIIYTVSVCCLTPSWRPVCAVDNSTSGTQRSTPARLVRRSPRAEHVNADTCSIVCNHDEPDAMLYALLAATTKAVAPSSLEQVDWSTVALNAVDDFGWTCLHWATYAGKQDHVVALVEAGADYRSRTKAGPPNATPLMLAINLKHGHIAEFLTEAESDGGDYARDHREVNQASDTTYSVAGEDRVKAEPYSAPYGGMDHEATAHTAHWKSDASTAPESDYAKDFAEMEHGTSTEPEEADENTGLQKAATRGMWQALASTIFILDLLVVVFIIILNFTEEE